MNKKVIMENQLTNTILMVPPYGFKLNSQATQTNNFIKNTEIKDPYPSSKAVNEFDNMCSKLKEHGIKILILENSNNESTPDAVFPNNWFSLHLRDKQQRLLIIYPMSMPNRRMERNLPNLLKLLKENKLNVDQTIDLTSLETSGEFLEGTGSMVFERKHKIGFAAISARTHLSVIKQLRNILEYEIICFTGYGTNNKPIYHTNVMLSVGEEFAVICSNCITNNKEKSQLLSCLSKVGKDIIDISIEQMYNMCGNIMQLDNLNKEKKIVISKTSLESFEAQQIDQLSRHGEIIAIEIPTIEKIGGGSVRCMIAEIF